ncbi:putative baseplate assembly protein [Rhodanobacter sp. FW510-R12]|uniref:putative baseplate assembly protein n=1 Tax=unclassified Rhodanobacter TaxID=2621553 RepID=UPI0007AA2D5B|nr:MULTISPECIES: putative baseplate assembly protein [unclassified Rhodanobacter]KZC15632.1 putative baseplate assembly protein [Rhodanobacter sp. FW104-R8]KZC26213.1 putative baseplate assembly protein [Rhodanobacter sp. FW510-T8]KZC32832.1 putative baseplate assembly protein [Rhodanobacter sp. FW510-R10]
MSCCSACGKHACACGRGAIAGTPLPLYNRPGLDRLAYRVGTYADFRATMQADLSDAALPALAGLRTREADDPAMALLDAWAIGADVLSFYQERIANEGYLRTATERRSVLELARLVDYRLRPGVAASVYLAYTVEKDSPPVTIPAGARAQSIPAPGEQMQTFETAEPLDARHEWNALQPRLTQPQDITWDGISGGAIDTIWLAGTASNLKANDRLLFQFGDLASGRSVVRPVHGIEAQTQTNRTKVVLQPQDTTSVQLLAAARTALAALAGQSAEQPWIDALGNMCRAIVQGTRWDNSSRLMNSVFEGLEANVKAESDFVTAAQTILDGSAASPQGADFGGLFRALSLSPTLQPANSVRLARNVAVALGTPSDARPQLLLNFAPRLADSFYRAWTSVPQSRPSPALSAVYAMRVAAPLFGYNAPKTITITQAPGSSAGTTVTTTSYTEQTAQDESDGIVSLDNAYDGIEAGSYLAIQKPGDNVPSVWMAARVNTAPRTDYGISGKTTTIALADKVVNGQSTTWQAPSMSDIRGTLVHAQSELLTLAELVIGGTVGKIAPDDTSPRLTADDTTHLTLDGAVDGLKPGRWAIVAGQRTDVPGTNAVNAAELVMIAAVEQGVDANLPGDTVHSTLVFANAGLAYAYRRDTVSVYANVVRATHGETRNEVLGSGNGALPMQAFVLKQSPLTYVSAATVDGVQGTLAVRVNGMRWHETRNLAFVGAADRNFVTATDDGGKTTVQFGDGTHGARLPTGVENVVATYRNGIGMPGNVRAQQVSLLATKPLGVKAVINPLRASGGADAETRDQARRNVPLAVLALDRLVSVPDYADFARTFGGVGKAAAIKLGDRVQVTIAGAADAPVEPTSDLYRNLLQALQRYGDPSLPVRLDVRELLALTVSAKVGLRPDVTWESVEPALRAALLDAFGFERRALAQAVYLSELVACMQAVRGVAWVDVDAFGSLDEATLLAGFGAGGGNGKHGDAASLTAHAIATATAAVPPRVQVLPARYDDNGMLRPAQLAYLPPNVPDTLLLQEATS